MPAAYWGIAGTLSLAFPDSWQEWLLLIGYVLLFLLLLFRDRSNLQEFSRLKWLAWLVLGTFALIASQLFPISFRSVTLPVPSENNSSFSVALLAAVPALLAGAILGPAPALFVGMSSGLGRALGQSHQVYDLFHYAFSAWIAAYLLRLRYHGRLYRVLRMPSVSGVLSYSAIAIMAGFVAFVSIDTGFMGRFDVALAVFQDQFLPLFIEGLVGGAIVALMLIVMPVWQRDSQLVPPPAQRSVRRYLLTNLLLFGISVLFITSLTTVVLTTFVSTRLAVAEMAAGANATAAQLEDFRVQMENLLVGLSEEDDLLVESKVNARALGQFYREAEHFEEVLLIGEDQRSDSGLQTNYTLPEDITPLEQEAVRKALKKKERSFVFDVSPEDKWYRSLVLPGSDRSPAVLIGRLKEASFIDILVEQTQYDRHVSGAILDANGRVLAEVGSGSVPRIEVDSLQTQPVSVPDAFKGAAYLTINESGTRQLVYQTPAVDRKWRVAVSVPYEALLSQGLGMAAPLLLALIAVSGIFYARLSNYSKDLSGLITELTRSSREVADGRSSPSQIGRGRHDELGELSRAFSEMQRGIKLRLDELSLLLSVSRESSTSMDLTDSMPVIMHGAIRGTGAAGVRAIVLNPTTSHPLIFAEGPSAEGMKVLDRPLMSILREIDDIQLESPESIHPHDELANISAMPVGALYARALRVKNRFLGVIIIGFRRPRTFSDNDIKLIETLAGQAAALVDKSYLFAHAEGGRRRLAAILASTSEAVIVTDQTSRILIINRAIERAFNVQAKDVVGRMVSDILKSPTLVKALTEEESDIRNLEIEGLDKRSYYANTSTIINHEGQALGRVAVLHDITDLKEVERVKSEFVDNVSHDLRTPLTVLSGYASALAMMDDLTPDQRQYTDSILLSVERMIDLVENLLDLGRIEAGVDLVFEDIDVSQMLQELADEHWLFAHDSGIRLYVRTSADLPMVRGDRALLKQAVSNLLTNGFKYAPNGGEMTLAAEESGQELVISVRDRGPGVSKQDQAHLFEKFYRVKRHGAGKVKGSGLGLAIVKGIAEKHGGDAWCRSELGKGSTFYISLPLE